MPCSRAARARFPGSLSSRPAQGTTWTAVPARGAKALLSSPLSARGAITEIAPAAAAEPATSPVSVATRAGGGAGGVRFALLARQMRSRRGDDGVRLHQARQNDSTMDIEFHGMAGLSRVLHAAGSPHALDHAIPQEKGGVRNYVEKV